MRAPIAVGHGRGIGVVLAIVLAGSCGAPVHTPPSPTAQPTRPPVPPTISTTAEATRMQTPSPPASEGPAGGPALLLVNGNVITVDAEFSMASAAAIDGGRIVAVGTDREIRGLAGSSTRVVELAGRTVMPGVVDPHTHSLQHEALSGHDALAAAEELLIANGRTTVGNPGIQADALDALREFAASGRSRLRLHMYLAYNDFCDSELGHWYDGLEFSRDPALRQAVAGIKLFLDGGACDAPAVSFEWDTHRWSGQGDLFVDAEQVAGVITTADSLAAQVVMHSAGDRALDAGLDGLELALEGGANPNRHRFDHLMFVRPDQLDRLGPLGAPPVLFGTHQSCLDTEDSSVVRYLDAEALGWLEPRRQLIDANPQVMPAWHSDAPLLSVSIFEHLAGLTGMGQALGTTHAGCENDTLRAHSITTREAITMMTIGGAHAMQLEAEVGSIEVGKAADLVVLARDPLALSAAEHLDNALLATMIEGAFAWCADEAADLCAASPPSSAGPSPTAGRPVGLSVLASAHVAGAGPERAVDGDRDAGWMAGADAPQWVEIDLGTVRQVALLRLHVDQDPAGFTRHVISGGRQPAPTTQLVLLEGKTQYGDVLEVEIGEPLRFIRVETVDSPSWVGWLEIEVVTEW